MKVWVLGSGSRGNAILVESGSCRVLIDAGFGPRVLQKRMRAVGIAPESVEGCIVTHEHSDHSRGAVRAARRWKWQVYATPGTLAHSRLGSHGAVAFAPGATLTFSELSVATFATPHDAAEPVGVVATATRTGARAAICTDVGYASRNLRRGVADVDILVLEANHDETMLANGPYPPWLQARIASRAGHLSNRECASLVRDSVTRQLRQIVLAHLSEHNNTPTMAYDTLRAAIKGTGYRGALIPAMQDSVSGPFVATGGAGRAQDQLSLGL